MEQVRRTLAPVLVLAALWLPASGAAEGPRAAPPAEPTIEILTGAVTGEPMGGDGQSGVVHRPFAQPLRVQVRDAAGRPLPGAEVRFRLLEPDERELGTATADQLGIASFNFPASGKADRHIVEARLPGTAQDGGRVMFRLEVRKRGWVVFLIFGLAGGLGLFLFGMTMMSNALQRSAGHRLRSILSRLTVNRFVGLGVGAFVTMLVQSSSATTVMLVSFVQARLLTFAQTLGVILGADIGTTVTAQLIAFKLTDYALLLIAVGFGMRLLGRNQRTVGAGDIILGFGILFFGMDVMSEAMRPLRTYQPFLMVVGRLENPLLGILVGTLFTALIQSSAAFIGIVIVLAQQGLISLVAGVPLILGANVGTCITALLASIGADRPARRVALAHTGFKLLGVLLMIWWIPEFAALVQKLSPPPPAVVTDPEQVHRMLPREIANAHTIFNVGLALICLPFTGLVARAVERLLPDKPAEEKHWVVEARHLDRDMVKVPALALNLAKVEILRLGDKVRTMAIDCLEPFLRPGGGMLDRLHEEENKVDALDEQITAYLLLVGKQKLSEEQTREVYMMLHVTKQFEQIADIIDKQVRPLAMKMRERGAEFSPTGRAEVETYHRKMCKQVSRALETFRDGSLEMAEHMRHKQKDYVALETAYRQAHFERVRHAVAESLATSEVHLELMDCFRRISSQSTNVGRALMTINEHGENEYGFE